MTDGNLLMTKGDLTLTYFTVGGGGNAITNGNLAIDGSLNVTGLTTNGNLNLASDWRFTTFSLFEII